MATGARFLLPIVLLSTAALTARAQVFVVGEHSAMAEVRTDFTPTSVPLSDDRLTERGSRDLERMLVAEQGHAHRALPLSEITLEANGPLKPGEKDYRHLLFSKGQAAAAGDRVVVTALDIKGDRMIIDLNGGPYAKHRFLSHVQFNNSNVARPQEQATGSRVTLVFPRGIPDISAPEVKALLEPVVDFGLKTSEQAYADTLPPALRQAIAAHEVLVGMNHRMVIAALGQPESKVHERPAGDPNGARYEEWIYGHVPQTVQFVRFAGDRVSMLEVAELGKPLKIHDQDQLGGFAVPTPTREIQMGDPVKDAENKEGAAAPSLRRPGEAPVTAGGPGRVQMPAPPTDTAPPKTPLM